MSESGAQPIPGLLQKYNGRVLLITTGTCAVHCRYCFRRHFPYQDSSASSKNWKLALEYINNDLSINEVILSGGDPLTLSDRRLTEICSALSRIQHIKRIRVHTRIPVVLPARITATLLKQITTRNKSIIFVIHSNHANEWDNEVANAIKLLQQSCILVLNQSVLLKGVNDSVQSLIDLYEWLAAHNVVLYYLHLLDPTAGAAHYDVMAEQAQHLIREMQASVSGYLIPKLVKEEIGAPGKTLLAN